MQEIYTVPVLHKKKLAHFQLTEIGIYMDRE